MKEQPLNGMCLGSEVHCEAHLSLCTHLISIVIVAAPE